MATAADIEHDHENYRVPHGFFTSALSEIDPAVQDAIRAELKREQTQIELIASENIVSRAVSSNFAHKYIDSKNIMVDINNVDMAAKMISLVVIILPVRFD
jgi:hypothetical protein